MSKNRDCGEYKVKTGYSIGGTSGGFGIYVNGKSVVKTQYADIFLLVAKRITEITGLDVEKMAIETIKTRANPVSIGVKR